MALTKHQHKKRYMYEVDDSFHIDLAEAIKNAKCFVAISGYDSPLYNELFSGLKKNINKISKANVGKIETRECLWTNYDIDKLQGQLKLNM